MKKLGLLLVPLLIMSSSGLLAKKHAAPTPRSDTITAVKASDPVMNAAIAEAKRTLPKFLAILAAQEPSITEIGFKYPLGGWEHIWVTNVRRDGPYLRGDLANEPAQRRYKLGDPVKVKLADVSDWAYRDKDGVMQGHYTTRVLFSQIDPEDAANIKASFKW